MMKEILKRILSLRIFVTLVTLLTSVWVYIPVVAGILVWMAMWIPAFYSASWCFFYFFGSVGWMNKTLHLDDGTLGVKILFAVEIVLIIIGLVLFFWGLFQIARAKLNKTGLVTGGLYKYLRHPQHLGIIIIAFAFSLYIPRTEDWGIRSGEILSWSLFVMIQFLWTDYEERRLAKKFGEEFDEYRKRTGSFFPRIFNKNKERKSFNEITYWKRYLFAFLAYLVFVVIVYVIVYILSLPSIDILRF